MSAIGVQSQINKDRALWLSTIPSDVIHGNIICDTILANAGYISTLYSDNTNVSSLQVSTLGVKSLDVSGMYVSSIRGNTAFFSSMTLASDLSGGVGYVRFSVDASGIQVDGDPIRFDNLVYLTSTINIIQVSTLVDTDIFASNGYFSTLSSGTLSTGQLQVQQGLFSSLQADYGSFNRLFVSSLEALDISGVDGAKYWSQYPTLASSIIFQPSYILSNVNNQLYFAGTELTDASGGGRDWSQFPAQTDVSMNNFSLRDVSTLQYQDGARLYSQTGNNLFYNGQPVQYGSASNVSQWANYPAVNTIQTGGFPISSIGNLTVTANSNIRFLADGISTVADNGIDIGTASRIDLTAQNGLQGQINMTANPGYQGLYGAISMTANGGTVAGVGTGGLISLTANTPTGTLCNATSAIKLSASGVNSYAGVVPPIGSLAGYNFIYGTGGVNICTGLPSVLPNVPLTTYLYGTAGVTTSSDFYVPNIYPYWNGLTTPPDMNITGRYIVPNLAQVYVNLSNVKNIYMDATAQIQNARLVSTVSTVGSVANFNTGQFGTVSAGAMGASAGLFTTLEAGSISTSLVTAPLLSTINLNVSTINGHPFSSIVTPQNIDCSNINVTNTATIASTNTTTLRANFSQLSTLFYGLGLGVSTVTADHFGQRVWVSDSIIGTTNLGPVDARIINFSSIQSGTMSTIDLVCSTINGAPPGGGGGGGGFTSSFSTIFTSTLSGYGGFPIEVTSPLFFSGPDAINNLAVINTNPEQVPQLLIGASTIFMDAVNVLTTSLSTTRLQTSSLLTSSFLAKNLATDTVFTSSLQVSTIGVQSGGVGVKVIGPLEFASPNSLLNTLNINTDQSLNLNLNANQLFLNAFNTTGESLSSLRIQSSKVKVSTLQSFTGTSYIDVSGGFNMTNDINIPDLHAVGWTSGEGYTRLERRDIATNNMLSATNYAGLASNNMAPLAVGELWLTGGADQYEACRLYSQFPYGNYELDAIDADGATLFAFIQGYYNPDGLNPGYTQAYSNVSSISGYDQGDSANQMLHVINGLTTSNLIVSSINGGVPGSVTSSFQDLYTSSFQFSTATSVGSNTNFNYPIFIDYDQAGNTTTAGVAIAVQGHNLGAGAVVNRIEMGARATGENYIMSVWPGQNLEELYIDATDVTIRDGIFSTIINLDPWGLQTEGGIKGPFMSTLALNVSTINNNDARPAYTNNLQLSTMTLATASTTLAYWDSVTTSSNINTSGYDVGVGVQGTYKMGFSLQATNVGGNDDLSFFFYKNGTAIPNSATYTLIKNNEFATAYCEIIEPLNNGDIINVAMYTAGAGVIVSTITGVPGAGDAPAGIFTMYKIA